MAPLSEVLAFDATNPSISERVIRHKWKGPKYNHFDGNFHHWSEKLKDFLILNGIYAYIFSPTISCPNASVEPRAYANWQLNDRLTITFIKSALNDIEHRDVVMSGGAAMCFEDLKSRAQREGPIKQVGLLQEALSTYCSSSEPLPVTAGRIVDIVKRAFDIKSIDVDLFTCIALLNSLNDPSFESLQNSVSTVLSKGTKEKPCTPIDIRLLMENAQNIINSKASNSTALHAKGGGRSTRITDLPGHNHGPIEP